ncbi:hypothetical protein BX667DRAFT_505819 [Coemansia mojavensis]|nr:hypothetical protein BX667DRAFT_505819 [Coemansia mojavensis]
MYGNISLAIDNKLHGLIKKLDIQTIGRNKLLSYFKQIIDIIKRNGKRWPCVTHINIDITFEDEQNVILSDEQIANFVEESNIALPNINKIELHDGYCDTNASWLNKLVISYVHQTAKFKSIERLALNIPAFSQNLTYLHMYVNFEDTPPLPKVCTETLQHLVLDGVPPNYSWNAFINDNSKVIKFTDLKTLKVFYGRKIQQARADIDFRLYEFHFPCLTSLSVYDLHNDSILLSQMKFPKRITSLFVPGSFQSICMLLKQKLQHVERLSMGSLDPEVLNIPENRLCYMQLIRKICKQESLCMRWLYDLTYKEAESLQFPHLRNLSIEGRIDLFKLLAVLKNATKLQSLQCKTIHIIHGINTVLKLSYLKKVLPMCLNLKYASIRLLYDESVINDAYTFVKYMLLSCTALKRFELLNLNTEPLRPFVEEYRDAYPHLSNVVIS